MKRSSQKVVVFIAAAIVCASAIQNPVKKANAQSASLSSGSTGIEYSAHLGAAAGTMMGTPIATSPAMGGGLDLGFGVGWEQFRLELGAMGRGFGLTDTYDGQGAMMFGVHTDLRLPLEPFFPNLDLESAEPYLLGGLKGSLLFSGSQEGAMATGIGGGFRLGAGLDWRVADVSVGFRGVFSGQRYAQLVNPDVPSQLGAFSLIAYVAYHF